jgi:predicted molibdopterin-dependent oxidoreductase YjgC
MTTEALFSIPHAADAATVTITFEGRPLRVPAGISVAAALLAGGAQDFRASVVGGVPRAPYCMMGVCFECLVEIDGVPARQSCLVPVRDGMAIRRQLGAAHLEDLSFGEEP